MFRWKRIEKHLPDTDRQVLVLCGSFVSVANYRNGDWWLSYSSRLGGVERWMDIPREPKDLAYWRRKIGEWWTRQKVTAKATSDYLTGWKSRNAQLSKKVIYYQNEKTGEIRMGLPENFPTTSGFQKVVCGSALEAERWSNKLRQYNLSKERMKDEERSQIEGEIAKQIRSEIHHRIANSRSKYGKVFMERALERMDKAESRRKMTREEYLHSEGYERGH